MEAPSASRLRPASTSAAARAAFLAGRPGGEVALEVRAMGAILRERIAGRGAGVANGAGYLWWSKFQQITITGQLSGRVFIGPMACAVAITNSELSATPIITPCIKMQHYYDATIHIWTLLVLLSRARPPLPRGQKESRMEDSRRQQRHNHGDAVQRVLVRLCRPVSVDKIPCQILTVGDKISVPSLDQLHGSVDAWARNPVSPGLV